MLVGKTLLDYTNFFSPRDYKWNSKNKHIKKNLAENFKSLADEITENLENCKRKDFHQLLRAYEDVFTKNIYATHDNIYNNLKHIINDPLKPNEQYVSYDVESFFTNVPIHEAIEFIANEIYAENKLPKLCSKLIFKRLLVKLTTENTFTLNSTFYKQVDGCSMGGSFSVIFSDI